jgi:hypothetical protein
MSSCTIVLRSCRRILLFPAIACCLLGFVGGFPSEIHAEMTVREYEHLRLSERQQDRVSVQLYVQGLINGLLWANTKTEKEPGLVLVCNSDKLMTHEQVYAIFDREIKRKGLNGDAKAVLPLGLIAVEALQREFSCERPPQEPSVTLMPGSRFAQYCNPENNLALNGICVGFISAVADLMNVVSLHGRRACFPSAFKLQEGVTVVQRWIDSHPNDVKYDGREIVILALSEGYPCPSNPIK